MPSIDPYVVVQVLLVVVVFHALLLSAAGMVWAERKVAARLQQPVALELACEVAVDACAIQQLVEA